MITQPPETSVPIAVKSPVPCISGQHGICRVAGPAFTMFATCCSSVAGATPPFAGAFAPAPSACQRSFAAHITPLGMPVVPPV